MRKLLASAVMMGLVCSPVFGQSPCASALTGAEILTLLSPGNNIYACGTSGTEKWNETLKLPNLVEDFKLGAPPDPSAIVGTFNVTGGSSTGVITYDYGPGAVFTYNVSRANYPTVPGTYVFCQISPSPGTNYNISISVGPGTC